jgi:hypothetical protein
MGVAYAESDPSGEGAHSVEQDRSSIVRPERATSGGFGVSKQFNNAFTQHGGTFSTKQVTNGRVIGYSGQTRSSAVNWDAGATSPATFNQST